MKLALLAAGRLSQTCRSCGVTEAAGTYCTACLTPMSEADWDARAVGHGARRRKAETAVRPSSRINDRSAA